MRTSQWPVTALSLANFHFFPFVVGTISPLTSFDDISGGGEVVIAGCVSGLMKRRRCISDVFADEDGDAKDT